MSWGPKYHPKTSLTTASWHLVVLMRHKNRQKHFQKLQQMLSFVLSKLTD